MLVKYKNVTRSSSYIGSKPILETAKTWEWGHILASFPGPKEMQEKGLGPGNETTGTYTKSPRDQFEVTTVEVNYCIQVGYS